MHGVQRYVPEFEKRWHRFARNASSSWRVDQTYMRVRGTWLYLYRAVDREGKTVDFRLSPRRNVAAAKAFLREARHAQAAAPTSITLDGYAASHWAVRELAAENPTLEKTKRRSSKYLNLPGQPQRKREYLVNPSIKNHNTLNVLKSIPSTPKSLFSAIGCDGFDHGP
jgi:transposase-like protein